VSETLAPPEPLVVHLGGELDLSSHDVLESKLENALGSARPILVDVGDCSFVDVGILRMLADFACRAGDNGVGYVVVLPFASSRPVREILLGTSSELARFPIAPTRRAGLAILRRDAATTGAERAGRIRAARAEMWENASRLEELTTRRDELILERRRLVAEAGSRRRSST
jgi:anti-anti-sigma regulatory factor